VLAARAERIAAGRPSTARPPGAVAGRRARGARRRSRARPVELARLVAARRNLSARVPREVGVPDQHLPPAARARAGAEASAASRPRPLAADAGFADHAHLTREMRALLGLRRRPLQREIAGRCTARVVAAHHAARASPATADQRRRGRSPFDALVPRQARGVLGGDVAGRARGERAAAEAADGRVEDRRAVLEPAIAFA
jgi:hypothetical protein